MQAVGKESKLIKKEPTLPQAGGDMDKADCAGASKLWLTTRGLKVEDVLELGSVRDGFALYRYKAAVRNSTRYGSHILQLFHGTNFYALGVTLQAGWWLASESGELGHGLLDGFLELTPPLALTHHQATQHHRWSQRLASCTLGVACCRQQAHSSQATGEGCK